MIIKFSTSKEALSKIDQLERDRIEYRVINLFTIEVLEKSRYRAYYLTKDGTAYDYVIIKAVYFDDALDVAHSFEKHSSHTVVSVVLDSICNFNPFGHVC